MADATPVVNQAITDLRAVATIASATGDHTAAASAAVKAADMALAVAPDGKPGWKSSEFWFCVAMFAAGFYLSTKPGQETMGGILMTASGLGHVASRTVVKATA
jgi:hypothetical protein